MWTELVDLGAGVRDGSVYADAWDVACETMHRARDYDFFHLGGDDMYVVVDNLRRLLLDRVVEEEQENDHGDGPLRRATRRWPACAGLNC